MADSLPSDTDMLNRAKASKITQLSNSDDPLDLRKYDVPSESMKETVNLPNMRGISSLDNDKATELVRLGAKVRDARGIEITGGPNAATESK